MGLSRFPVLKLENIFVEQSIYFSQFVTILFWYYKVYVKY